VVEAAALKRALDGGLNVTVLVRPRASCFFSATRLQVVADTLHAVHLAVSTPRSALAAVVGTMPKRVT
jgi:hypothetical protein